MRVLAAFLSFVLTLYGCGGGGGGATFPGLPALMPAQGKNAPIVFRTDGVQVGGDVRPARNALSPAGRHGEVAISTGRVRDGENADRVLDILKKHAVVRLSSDPGNLYLRIFEIDPVIRIRETTPDRYIDEVVRVVQLINTALPYNKRMTVSPERAWHPVPPDAPIWVNYIPDGHIFVGIAPQDTWPQLERPPVRVAGVQVGDSSGTYIWLNTNLLTNRAHIRKVLAHEIGHAIGTTAHIEPHEFRSIMNTGYLGYIPAHILYPIDTDAIHAIYTRFFDEYGTSKYDPNKLGAWTDASFHLRGDMDDVSFGASSRNGLIQPWAFGPSPSTNFADNQALSGSVSWSGRLLGFTSNSESLAGAADLTINLVTLRGRIDFTGLEHWSVQATPGAIGSGRMWNDGDLRYGVIVRGNSFVQTGGDAGEVTGMFYGAEHQAMGGVVERSDMAAGFGGKR